VAVKVTGAPAPPLALRLIEFLEQLVHVTITVSADGPTVTCVVPLAVPDVAVMVTEEVGVFATPLIKPVLLTVTCNESELVQLTLRTLPVLPSLNCPVATNCIV
jgi:hypothetical protein